jgi:hypothetical protein
MKIYQIKIKEMHMTHMDLTPLILEVGEDLADLALISPTQMTYLNISFRITLSIMMMTPIFLDRSLEKKAAKMEMVSVMVLVLLCLMMTMMDL